MIRVEQRQLWRPDDHPDGSAFGDCLRACVASVLELPYETVPDLRGDDQKIADWLRGTGIAVRRRRLHGFEAETLESWRDWPTEHHEQGYWIATVYSHRIPDVELRGCGCEGLRPDCEWCGGEPESRVLGIAWGLHAVVMRNRECVWDPHPERDRGFGPLAGAMTFYLEDPAPAARALLAEEVRDAA